MAPHPQSCGGKSTRSPKRATHDPMRGRNASPASSRAIGRYLLQGPGTGGWEVAVDGLAHKLRWRHGPEAAAVAAVAGIVPSYIDAACRYGGNPFHKQPPGLLRVAKGNHVASPRGAELDDDQPVAGSKDGHHARALNSHPPRSHSNGASDKASRRYGGGTRRQHFQCSHETSLRCPIFERPRIR